MGETSLGKRIMKMGLAVRLSGAVVPTFWFMFSAVAVEVRRPTVTIVVPRPTVNVPRPTIGAPPHPIVALPRNEAIKSGVAAGIAKTGMLKSTTMSGAADPIVKNGHPAAKVQSSTTLRDSADGVGSAPLTNAGPSSTAPGVLPAKSTSSDVIVNPSSIAAPANAGSGVVVNGKSIPAGTAASGPVVNPSSTSASPPGGAPSSGVSQPGDFHYPANYLGSGSLAGTAHFSTQNGQTYVQYTNDNGLAGIPIPYNGPLPSGVVASAPATPTGSGFSYGTVGGVNYGVTLADPAQAPVRGSQQGQGPIVSGGNGGAQGPATPVASTNGGGQSALSAGFEASLKNIEKYNVPAEPGETYSTAGNILFKGLILPYLQGSPPGPYQPPDTPLAGTPSNPIVPPLQTLLAPPAPPTGIGSVEGQGPVLSHP